MRNEILRMLENNSRIDLHDLAIMLGTDESMVLEEIEKMENEGIICGYPTPVSYTHLDVYKRQSSHHLKVVGFRLWQTKGFYL